MSKLLKFQSGLSMEESATLLSSLIDEPATIEDIEHLYMSGWLTVFYYTDANLLALHDTKLEEPKYFVHGDKGVGKTTAVYLPCKTVELVGLTGIFTLADIDGNLYVIRDNSDLELHGLESTYSPDFSECLVDPHEIYRIAEICNSKGMPSLDDRIAPTVNRYATFPNSGELYNFHLSEISDTKPQPQGTVDTEPKTSQLLAISSILDIAMEKADKRFNQSSLIDEIMERAGGRRGLSQSGLTKLFASAKKAAEDWKKQ